VVAAGAGCLLARSEVRLCLGELFVKNRRDALAAPFEQGEIGPELSRHACLMGLEGLVSKNRSHPAFARVMDAFG
jgi:hypothetical protein